MIRKTSSNPKKLTAIKQKSRINPSIPSHQPVDSERTLFPVVGIGVSATELSSLRQFFTRMPADSGAAFVVIQQSDATQGNLSPLQLQDVTSMQIVHVENLMEVQPDCIYIVVQSGKNIFISNGFLCVLDAEPGHASNSLIDFFFHSLAEEYRESAVGVIFSGLGANGTQGLRAIRKKGGLGLAQDSMFSEPGGMRDRAIEASTVDTLVALDVLPDIVTSYLKSKSQGFHLAGAMSEVVQLLSKRMGNDFSQYKRSTLYRRVDRRMQQNQISKVEDYARFLNENPVELDLLFKELLINVTHFFRDPVMWQYVKAEIIPPILAAHPEGKTVRIWVPACSTGEEAYGFAILFREALEQRGVQDRYLVKIFATDLDQDAITKARQGFYPIAISQYISLERLNRFFVKHENGYRVCNEIRQMVIFAPQNLIADVPFSKLDILSCRNLLIYLDRELQKRLLPLFYYALNPDGILLLGTAESIDYFPEMFTPLERSLAVYKRLNNGLQQKRPNLIQDFSLQAMTKKNPMISLEEILRLSNIEQAVDLSEKNDDIVLAMMTELQLMREEMQATHEEMQTSQEELRSSNEELQSTNEELLSTNKELQTANAALVASKSKLKLLYKELQSTNAELTAYLEAIGQLALVSVSDRSGRIIEANDRFCEISGYGRSELIGQDHRILNSGVHSSDFFIDMWETITNGKIWHKEICNRRKSGSLYWVDSTIVPFKDSNGQIIRYISVRVDITARKQKELILHERLKERTCLYAIRREMEQDLSVGELCERIFDHLIPAMQFPDHAACMISIYEQRYTSNHYNEDLTHGIFARIKVDGHFCGQLQVFYREEKSFMLPDEQNLINYIADDFRLWLERRQLEQHISFMANHDVLTGLPNRLLLQDRLSQALAHNQRHHDFSAVLFIDLDHFKVVNDTLGHGFGDLLLKEVAVRLLSSIRSEDTASRQGGDEFIVILTEITDLEDVESIAKKILHLLALPYHINERILHIDSSIGIALYPKDGKDVDALLKHSDLAMYHAKATGRSNYQFYSAEMDRLIQEKHELGNDLHRAIRNNELILYYQPIIDMNTNDLVSLEVLLRWQHPEKGLIPPVQFIKLAEETGLILPIGDWVIRSVCEQLKAWQDQGLSVPRIAINLSVKQFQKKLFVQDVANILTQAKVSASCLTLEITESMLAENIVEVNETLQQLSAMGFKISIDDFGTGYSNLSYLKHYTIDALKIDRSFVRDIAIDENDAAIVTAIIAMAGSLNIQVIAEGVESKEQIDFLKQRGCSQYQGFYFSKPLSALETIRKLKQFNNSCFN
ncbi:EAL domain-containing protein [Nitrosomonas oligotropha]|uniref:EAL domain-containing protein n=1 Tax=Nitrosomonas oligotropha TaxID=42354 RepID=UPI0023DC2A53|nr:EAL domain-containing protein [Nitrosomonas oligotropha]MXS82519.1 EAL domain-containing protein [Nitrosomonas oligotropha]